MKSLASLLLALCVVNTALAEQSKTTVSDTSGKFYVGLGMDVGSKFRKLKYVEVDHVAVYLKKRLKSSSNIPSIYFGYKFSDTFSADISAYWKKVKYEGVAPIIRTSLFVGKQNIALRGVSLDGYWTLPLYTYVKPYAKVGVGYAKNRSSIYNAKIIVPRSRGGDVVIESCPPLSGGETSSLTYNVALGLKFKVLDSMDFDIGYGHFDFGQFVMRQSETEIPGVDTVSVPKTNQRVKVRQLTLRAVYYL
ncbi:outer membrane beta-barrel protein [Rickettsiales endosymbiont of Peranema trichophorum]|uniref:outer membrane beta-barrel protein n=1 Tax=Rickettsiales endosymbiont of Peranema trichophorum TaxID=2486577 RepID=UPI0013EE3F6E|nr:outer membrane beta-barrel protein [Rickettsiales endosymbiont of Peranema trichophorum]